MPPEAAAVPFRKMTVEDFIGQLASEEPVPGGGSASAVAASLGAALVTMVATLSSDRPRYADHAATHARSVATGRRLASRFLELADDDAAAYGSFAIAMKMPRETEDDRARRSARLRAAALTATQVPFACVEACRDLVAATEELAGRSNVNAASDLAVASLLGEAAARGAAANVRINLPALGDPARAAEIESRVDALLVQVTSLAERTRSVVASGEARDPLPADLEQ
ncbi:MAG: cyclodeaminase/cyclohydrolase family protein [Chloroflexi bacterium]|nr:cyclodeaminase/cyclohydrolase family protein [Chloroflexota bacterium]